MNGLNLLLLLWFAAWTVSRTIKYEPAATVIIVILFVIALIFASGLKVSG